MTWTRNASVALAVDVLSVAVFVAIGRRNHDEGSAVGGILETAAPFLIGLAVGWLGARAWRHPMALGSGVVIWLITVAVGMACRRLLFDRGTAVSFVIVATVFLGLCLVGWRAIATLFRRDQNSTATAGTS